MGNLSSLQKSVFLKLIILIFHVKKLNNYLVWIRCWFLGKNLSNFIYPVWKLHNPYCHRLIIVILIIAQWYFYMEIVQELWILFAYRITSYSFRRIYSFFNLEIVENSNFLIKTGHSDTPLNFLMQEISLLKKPKQTK